MYKIIESGSWDALESQGIANVLPVRKNGSITQNDRRTFFHKTAASERFLLEIENIKIADGDIPVHVNAIGAAEYYGPNRKGDAFSEAVCRERHHTFVTEGRNYVHHKNRDPEYSFGKIASSCYNDAMHRIELLVLTNGNEAATRRNGGHVIPDEFLTKLEKNAEVPVSMGCTIDYDVCSICGNRARTRAEYCDAATCRHPKTAEYFPGCKSGLMKIASDGTQQYVYNIRPTFFDLSYVGVPADRTGYGFRADYLPHSFAKEAALESHPAEAFYGVKPRSSQNIRYRYEMMSMLGKLASFERQCTGQDNFMAYGVRVAQQQDTQLGQKLAAMLPATRAAALRYLADHGVLLSPDHFVAAFGMEKRAAQNILLASGTIYADTCSRYHRCRQDLPASLLAAMDDTVDLKLASVRIPRDLLEKNILSLPKIASLVPEGTVRFALSHGKTAAVKTTPLHRETAEFYALYKAAALCRFPEHLKDFGVKLAVWQTMEPDAF